MTDEKIKEEFEKWVQGDATPDESDFIESVNDPSWQCEAVGFYAGFRAAERLAKIEVLEEVRDYVINSIDPFARIDEMLSELKAGQ
jgi:hypothetical protein